PRAYFVIAVMRWTTTLYQERLPVHPWDLLLAAGVLVTAAIVPVIVRVGSRLQEQRTERLRAEFGSEYDDLVNHHGDWRKAESVMVRRRRGAGHSGAGPPS